jgi:hypothetical protein
VSLKQSYLVYGQTSHKECRPQVEENQNKAMTDGTSTYNQKALHSKEKRNIYKNDRSIITIHKQASMYEYAS